MTRVGVGIIGCGTVARRHAAAYRLRDDAEIRALSDISPHALRAMGEALGVEDFYTDFRELLERDDIQALSICTPHALHVDQFLAAVERGKHVCVEKPLGIKPEQTARMVAAAEEAGVIACVGLPLRYYPSNQHVRGLVQGGYVGEVVIIKQTMGVNFLAQLLARPAPLSWSLDQQLSGGGVLMSQTIHYLDLLTWLCPSPVESVLADVWRACGPAPEGFDTNAVLSLKHVSGARSVIENSWVAEGHPAALEVYGTEGSIVGTSPIPYLSELTIKLRSRRLEALAPLSAGPGAGLVVGDPVRPGMPPEGHNSIIARFLDSIHSGELEGDLPTLRHGHELQRLIEAAYRSAREGRRVAVSEVA